MVSAETWRRDWEPGECVSSSFHDLCHCHHPKPDIARMHAPSRYDPRRPKRMLRFAVDLSFATGPARIDAASGCFAVVAIFVNFSFSCLIFCSSKIFCCCKANKCFCSSSCFFCNSIFFNSSNLFFLSRSQDISSPEHHQG